MEPNKIRVFVTQLRQQEDKHPVFVSLKKIVEQSKYHDLKKEYSFIVNKLSRQYMSPNSIDKSELKQIYKSFSNNIHVLEFQTLILETILTYAFQNEGIESCKAPRIFRIKSEKSIPSELDFINLQFAHKIFKLIKSEIKSPNRNLSDSAVVGRDFLILLFLTRVKEQAVLLKLVSTLGRLTHAKEFSFWVDKDTSLYLIICDVVKLSLLNLKSLDLKQPFLKSLRKASISKRISSYLREVGALEAKSMTFRQLLALKKAFYDFHFSPICADYYLNVNISTSL